MCEMGDCQNYGPFLGPYYNTGPNTGPFLGDPKRDHNFDNPPNPVFSSKLSGGRKTQYRCRDRATTTDEAANNFFKLRWEG